MNQLLLHLVAKMQTLMIAEEGQDLVEYAEIVALIALGSTAVLQSLAGGMNNAFINISSTLVSCLS